jgi:hypothetical protein
LIKDLPEKHKEQFRKLLESIAGKYDLVDYVVGQTVSKSRVVLKCPIHGSGNKFGNRWVPLAYSVIKGSGCPKCSGRYIFTEDELIESIESLGYEFINFIGEFKGLRSKLNLGCPFHGEGLSFQWTPIALNVISHGKGCPKCKGVYKRTFDEWIEEINSTKYTFLSRKTEFKGKNTRITVSCPKHGDGSKFDTPWIPRFEDIVRGNGCPKCASLYRFSEDEYKLQIETATKYRVLDFSSEKKAKHTKVALECPEHGEGLLFGNPWYPTINNVLRGAGCPKCANTYVYSADEIVSKINEIGHGRFRLSNNNSDFSKGVKSRVELQCLIDENFTWETNADCIFCGTSCPHCSSYGFNESKPAYFYLQDLYIDDEFVAVKLGITNRQPLLRMKQQNRSTTIKQVLNNFVYHESGKILMDFERRLLEKYKFCGKRPILSKDVFPDGYTETVCVSLKNEILAEMSLISELMM